MKYGVDIIGDIAIFRFHRYYPSLLKRFVAWRFMNNTRNINVCVEKASDISGELRIFKTKHLVGEKRLETVHNENGCKFFLNVSETYFSPRLSNERRVVCEEIANSLKNGQNVLVMFAGVAPFPIVLARMLKLKKIKAKIISSELNEDASEYAKRNVRENKVEDFVEVVVGDSRRLKIKKPFEVILMPRPNLEETFLDAALKFSKKGTKIYYHGFGTEEKVLEEIKKDAGKKIGKVKIRKAGDIAPGKWRWLAEFSILTK
jgi:tRNA (guanine37-N1)-methyltransferase